MTPDYVYTDDTGLLQGWLDVKTTDRAFTYPAKWHSAEAAIYTYGMLLLNGGELPWYSGTRSTAAT